MDTAIQNENELINLRLKSSAKRLIIRAAGFESKTVSSFILTSALKCAEEAIQEHHMISLNEKNSRVFFDALTEPVQFNRKLTAAFNEYDKRVITE